MKVFYTFNMSDCIKYMWVGGGQHCGWQGQQGGGGEFLSTRMWYAVVNWWWWLTRKLFILSRCVTISRSCVLVVDNTVDGKDNMRRRPWIRWHYDVSLKLESLVFYSSLFASFSALMMSWTLELSHTLKLSKIWISHHQHSLSHTHPHWWTFKLKCYIKMSPTSLVSSTRLSLPTTMSMTLTTNTHVLNDVRHVESIKIFDVDPDHHSIWHPSWRKFQPKWYILM